MSVTTFEDLLKEIDNEVAQPVSAVVVPDVKAQAQYPDPA